ncbi:erythromycin esterase family protein [Hymenobacter convexus]|uniref:erythromycin esterase family protein n=1 Tax=Hymenobacter sp. CA1UV-4 TaxID=3063782 RepID=UPI0027135A68|nr:erythromycin esterase family protein [Hymenobacter sp. CA1UV-4]MDO7851208.1 erythromycin esterase family protein [Hymenobacter sp. CA1UV-4]
MRSKSAAARRCGGLLGCWLAAAPAGMAQARLNLALEPGANSGHPLVLWSQKVFPGTTLAFDSLIFRQGKGSLRFDLAPADEPPYAALYTAFSYPIDSVRGRIATVSGCMRTSGFRGRAGLYAYAHTPPTAGSIGLERVDQLDSLAATTDWRRIELRLPVKASATAFGLGLRVAGSGRIWFDDVQVRLDGRLLSDAPVPDTEALLLAPEDVLTPNWDFERLPPPAARPEPARLALALDSLQPQHGRRALCLRPGAGRPGSPPPAAYLGTLPIDKIRGKTLTVKGQWRTLTNTTALPGSPMFTYALLGGDGRAGRVATYVVARHAVAPTPAAPGAAWEAFSFSVPVPDDAALAALSLGVRVPGPAPLLLDNLTFTLDGRAYVPAPLPPAPAPTSAETAWLRKAATPLAPAAPEADLTDLRPLGELVGSTQVVGLGEVTHGSRDIFRMKRRIFRFLVEQKGFTGLALEAPQPACAALNAYIQTGEGDPAGLLRALGVWNTQEVLDLVRWMRAYRQQRGTKLFLAGIDMQAPELALAQLRQTARATDEFVQPRLEALAAAVAQMSRPGGEEFDLRRHPDQPTDPLLQTVRRLVGELRAGLDTRAKLAPTVSDARQLATQLHCLRLLEQGATFRRLPLDLAGPYRDACLAENVTWLRQDGAAGSATKLVVWAHNGHVATAGEPRQAPMGQWLRQGFGKGYFALGFAFGQGSYAAEGGAGSFYPATAQAPPPGAYEAWFQATGTSFLLDLRRPALEEANAWLFQHQLFRDVGIQEQPRNFRPHDLRGEFDALLYLKNSTPARHL